MLCLRRQSGFACPLPPWLVAVLEKMIACWGMFTGEREVVSYQHPHTSQKDLSLFKLYLQKIDMHQCL